MFADAEVKIPSGGRFSKKVTRTIKGQSSFRRRRQIGCASDYPRHVLSYRVQNLGRRVTTCEPLCVRLKRRNVFVPTVRQFSFLHAYEMIRLFGINCPVLTQLCEPFIAYGLAPSAKAAPK